MDKSIPLSASILSTSGVSVLNEVFAGETLPGTGSELTGSDVITGIFAAMGLCLAIYGLLLAFTRTLSHFRVSNAKSSEADYEEVNFVEGEDASWLYSFPNIQFAIALLVFVIPVWVFPLFGIIIGIFYSDMVLLAINKI